MQMIGTSFPFTLRTVNSPNENNPSNGPYVYPAMLSTASITERSFISLKMTMISKNKMENPMWTANFSFRFTPSVLFLNFKKSMQKEVVNPASAESALAYDGAVIRNKKFTPTSTPSAVWDNRGKSSSV
jgi:hypothetical protein